MTMNSSPVTSPKLPLSSFDTRILST
jgi:hypothetical protein